MDVIENVVKRVLQGSFQLPVFCISIRGSRNASLILVLLALCSLLGKEHGTGGGGSPKALGASTQVDVVDDLNHRLFLPWFVVS